MNSSTPSKENLLLEQPKQHQHGKTSSQGKHKPPRANKCIVLKGGAISTIMRVISPKPTITCQAIINQVGGHLTILPMEIQVCQVNKEVQVPIIKSNSGNHPMKSYSVH